MLIQPRLCSMKKLSAVDRNKKIYELLATLIKEANKMTGNEAISYPAPFTSEEVEKLFTGHIWGHREITLTILLARMLDPRFQASKNFYDCNPRSIYEKPIRELLRENGIPHKKSGPLNVAKNSQRIDKVWAHNKRGDGVAVTVALLVKKIEAVEPSVLSEFALAYIRRYLLEAVKVAQLTLKINEVEDPVFLYRLSRDLVGNVPDGGAMPQFLIGTLIDCFNIGNNSPIVTTGHLDSVSATNTTSKKPGDVMEELSDSSKRIYEITVKAFSPDRMIESHEAIKQYDKKGDIVEVFVICRDEDVEEEFKENRSSSYLMGTATYQDLTYYFINIYEFIQEKLILMTPEARRIFHKALVAYINEPNASEKVKRYFKEWHEQQQLSSHPSEG